MNEYEAARLLAERYIAYQPRTVAEVRRRLHRGGVVESVIERVVEELKAAGLLDDARFSAEWVESRSRSKRLGSRRLQAELRARGVSVEDAASALDSLDPATEMAAALEIARRRLGLTRGAAALSEPDPAEKRRLAAYLQRRGYTRDMVEQVFQQLFANTE